MHAFHHQGGCMCVCVGSMYMHSMSEVEKQLPELGHEISTHFFTVALGWIGFLRCFSVLAMKCHVIRMSLCTYIYTMHKYHECMLRGFTFGLPMEN